jgi:L,D-peptidoglycan transpeptidase YkuD (ErfK/YbiS/YcfS/YnhG family)
MLRVLGLFAVVFLSAAFLFGQAKKTEPATAKIPFERSLQAVVVTTPDWNNVHGTAQLFERKDGHSKWKSISDQFPVVVGRNGLGEEPIFHHEKAFPPIVKREGDGRAPAGLFPLTFTFGIEDVSSKVPFTKLDEFTECVDDTNSTFYNKIVNRMQVGNFDWKSSEKMFTVRPQYDLGVFVAYNSYPAIPGNGSCIFLHIWKDADTGTAGCTAMARENLEKVVRWLDPTKNPYLVQMPEAEYNSLRKSLKLPKLK